MQIAIHLARPSDLATYVRALRAAWAARRARIAEERILRLAEARLGRLSPHYLDDIGLSPAQPPLPAPRSGLPLMPRS